MPRLRQSLNRDWLFWRGDASGAHEPGFDDSQWQRIGLPHTFDLPYFRTPEFYVGTGWYRKLIRDTGLRPVLAAGTGQRPVSHEHSFLEFDGAFQVAEVFVNGNRAGEHAGGYTGFSIDITNLIQSGENLLAVRVNNEWNSRLAPRTGEHIFSGGLYRDVHLVITDALHVTWNGTRITTPRVSGEAGVVNLKTEVRNDSGEKKRCTLRTSVLDPAGKIVTRMESTKAIAPGECVEFDQTSNVDHPKLWHPDHPNLYSVRSEVLDNGTLVDEVESRFGFRWFEWTADRGFFLNGEHLYLRGANAHQDHAGWGISVTQAACRRDVQLIKDAGFNFVRGARYPHHPAFARACDEIGLIFWPENCFWGKGGFGPEGYWNASAYPVNPDDFEPFEEHCKQTLREMIRIDRNHPSIVCWSLTNEAFFTYNLDRARELIKNLAALSREADPTRPVAIGGAQRGDVDHLGDIAGYNGDGARLFIDPGVPNMVSEYGAISKSYDVYDPFFGELQEEKFPWRAGEAIWCAFDYGSIAGRQGLKGIVNHQRLPKRSWHWYRNTNLGIAPPTWPQPGTPRCLRLSADKTTINGTDATDDCQLIVTVCNSDGNHISTSPSVTLTIESGPGEFPTGRSITFDIATDIGIAGGQAAIAFRSYHGGESIICATSPGLEAATITISTSGEPRLAPGETPLVSDRIYCPPSESSVSRRAMRNEVNVALNRPTRASSESADHPARLANDGNGASYWSCAEGDAKQWWLVDLEGRYQMSRTTILFDVMRQWEYIIEVSDDAADWKQVVGDRSPRNQYSFTHILPPGTIARYLRVTIAGGRAEVREVEVYGILSVR